MLRDNKTFTPELLTSIGAGLLSGNTWNQQIANAGLGASTAIQQQKQLADASQIKNKTVQMLQAQNPELANAVASGMITPQEAFSTHMKQQQEAAKAARPEYGFQVINGKLIRTNKNAGDFQTLGDFAAPEKPSFKSVGNLLYNEKTGEWISPPENLAQSQNEYGLNPQTAVDEKGDPVLFQVGKDGKAIRTAMPEGLKLSKTPIKVDAGTHFILLDPVTRQPVGNIPKDIAGAAQQTALGKNAAEIQAALPSARMTAKMVSRDVADLIKDPGLSGAIGPVDSRLPTIFPSTARAESKIEKLQGQAFLQAREMLRGGGQITDFEGKRAEAAMVRMNRAQSEQDFKEALVEFDAAVQEGLSKLEAVGQGNLNYDPNAAAPAATPNVEDLVKKYGG